MQTAKIDFSKYINMNNRQLMNALISAENKREKAQKQVNEITILIEFLEKTINKNWKTREQNFVKMSDTKLFEFDNYSESKKAEIRARFEKEQAESSDND